MPDIISKLVCMKIVFCVYCFAVLSWSFCSDSLSRLFQVTFVHSRNASVSMCMYVCSMSISAHSVILILYLCSI